MGSQKLPELSSYPGQEFRALACKPGIPAQVQAFQGLREPTQLSLLTETCSRISGVYQSKQEELEFLYLARCVPRIS